MRKSARAGFVMGAVALAMLAADLVRAQTISVLPDQMSRIRLSNRDVNHLICAGGEIEDVKFSAEKGLAVEKGGSDAWIKFLVKESDDMGAVTRSYVTTPSEFFISCNGAIYPLYAEPSDIPAQSVMLMPGAAQRGRANDALLAPLALEERAVSITLALLQDRLPASFTEVAPRAGSLSLGEGGTLSVEERRRIEIEGARLSASEYLVRSKTATRLDERLFLDGSLGSDLFAITLEQSLLSPDVPVRLVIIRRSGAQ